MSGQNRAAKVGVAREQEKKQEKNYDREVEAGTPQAIVTWLNAITEGDHEPIPDSEWKAFNNHIRDGVMLCKAINKLLAADGKPPVKFQKKVMSPFVAMTNIENFNQGCIAYGVVKESTFDSKDVTEISKCGLYNALNGLSALGFCANSKQFMPAYLGEITKTLDWE